MVAAPRRGVSSARLMALALWIAALGGASRALFTLAWLPLKVGRFCLWLADRIDAGSDALAAYAASLAAEPERDTRAGGA